jgi:Serine protease Clip domain PPAF-2
MIKKLAIILVIFGSLSVSVCQESGIFWWKNKELTNAASQSRSSKDLSAKIRRLPQKFRHEDDTTTTTTTTTTKKTVSIYDRDSSDEEDPNDTFKYNNEPDCVCTPTYLCNENNTIITDGSGIINER